MPQDPSTEARAEHLDTAPKPGPYRVRILVMLTAAAYIYVFRRVEVVTSPYLWAEDAAVFLKEAMGAGLGSLDAGYAGQYFFVQRITALVSSPLPISWQAPVYVLVGITTAVLSCGWLLSPRWRFQVSIERRFLVLLALVCLPTVDETHANLTNVHWWLALGLVLIGLLHDPRSLSGRVRELTFVAVASATGFAALYGLPLLAVRAWYKRSRHSVALFGTALLGLGVQAGYLLSSQRQGSLQILLADPTTLVVVATKRVFGAMILGDQYLNVVWPAEMPAWWVFPMLAVLAASLFVLLAQLPRLVALGLVCVCIVGVALGLWATTMAPLTPAVLVAPGAASRYFLVPVGVLFIVLAVVERSSALVEFSAGVMAVLCLVSIASEYRIPPDTIFDQTPFYACVQAGSPECQTTVPPGWVITVTP
jgi:hypothetical protein